MDYIACEMCISKKTIYKYFSNKETLIEESTELLHNEIHATVNNIINGQYNAIEENFEIRRSFKELFKSTETSPIYQLKKHYPEIYEKVIKREVQECNDIFIKNIEKGKQQGLYREGILSDVYAKFYYTLIFNINENTVFEREAQVLELYALEYHIRAIATQKGITELERQLSIF